MTQSAFLPALLALQVGGGGLGSMTPFLLQLAAIFGIFYFLLIRPQAAQKKKHEAALRAIKRGDQIVTSGGIVGEVIHERETIADDMLREEKLVGPSGLYLPAERVDELSEPFGNSIHQTRSAG